MIVKSFFNRIRKEFLLSTPRFIVLWAILLTLFTPPLQGESIPTSEGVFRSPIFWAGSLTLATLLADRSVYGEVSTRDNNIINKVLGNGRYGRQGTIMEMMGQPTVTLPLSGIFYGTGVWLDDARARRVGKAGAVATLVTGGATLAIKVAVGRNRPYAGHDADEYHPFNTRTSGTSFPSGHASISFSMASVIADEYDDWRVDVLSYGTASAVALSRVYQDRHWASDVVGGAALGIVIGKWARRRAAQKDGHMVLTDGRRVYWAWMF